MTIFPRRDWDMLSHVLIFHGRRVCYARKPSCVTCTVTDVCPSAFKAELVGRKPGRADSDSTAKSRAGKGRGAAKNARAKPRPARANTGKGSKATSKVARAAKSKQSGPSAAR
jgi:endonuclease-3